MKATAFALLFVALLGLTAAAQAGNVIVYDNAAVAANQTGYTYGLDFNVTSSVRVDELGAFDSGHLSQLVGWDGSSGVTVGIFNRNTQTLVGSSVLFTGTNGTQVNGDAFLPVSFTLPAGQYTVVASNISAFNAGTVVTNPNSTENSAGGSIAFVGLGDYISGSTFTFPTSIDNGPTNRYDAGTFAVTPEPSSCVLAALGLVGLLCVGFRRMKARALSLLVAASPLLLLATSPAGATTIVSGWEVIDNSSTPDALGSFTTNGFTGLASVSDSPRDWNTTAAYDNGQGTSGHTATYTFKHLSPGNYVIATSISDFTNRATDAPYSINGGPSILVNEQVAATGPPTLFDGTTNIPFEILNNHFSFAGGNLTVVVTDSANNYVLADAIAIQAITPEPASFVLAGLGAVGLILVARRRGKA